MWGDRAPDMGAEGYGATRTRAGTTYHAGSVSRVRLADAIRSLERHRRGIAASLVVVFLAIVLATAAGLELPRPGEPMPELPGVRARNVAIVARSGAGGIPAGELAFMRVDSEGMLLVSDKKRKSILRISPTGQLVSEWGPGLDATQPIAEPAGVAEMAGVYYVVDRGNPRVIRLNGEGRVLGIIGLQPLSTYGLNDIALDTRGNVLVADTGRNRVLIFTPGGQLSRQLGQAGTGLGQFMQPIALAFGPVDALFVSDWENGRVERFGANLEATDAWPTGYRSFGLAVDPLGRVYTIDGERRRVDVFTPRGDVLGQVGGPGSPALDIVGPRQVAVAEGGRALYVLGPAAIARIDLENTPAPPRPAGSSSLDVAALAAVVATIALALFAVARRRGRPQASREAD